MKLADYLDREKITPSAFAARVGVSAATISRVLNGRRKPSFDVFRRIVEGTKGEVSTPDDLTPVERSAA